MTEDEFFELLGDEDEYYREMAEPDPDEFKNEHIWDPTTDGMP